MKPPTPLQEAAILDPSDRLQILACAGAGKTEVLARRAVELLKHNVEPEAIVTFTFTEKAAAQLKSRIELRAAADDSKFADRPPTARGMYIGTTHGFCLSALRTLGGKYETSEALTPEGEWALLLRFARRLGIVDLHAAAEGRASTDVAAASAIDAFLRSVEVVHNERIDRGALAEVAPSFAAVLSTYESLLAQMHLMPFRMMIGRAADALAPGGPLTDALAGTVRHLLVDEYQDFNRAQEAVVRGLAAGGATLAVVGDDDQAIYQWRGGDVSLLTGFGERYEGAKPLHLDVNHRCRPGIVDAAAGLVRGLADRADKALKAERAATPHGSVEVILAETPDHEAKEVAKRVAKVLASGRHAARDVAILFRSVRSSAEPFAAALDRRGIPCEVVGHTSLLTQQEPRLIAEILVYFAGGTWYPGPDPKPVVVTAERLRAGIERITEVGSTTASGCLDDLERLGKKVRDEGVSDSIPLFNEILAILSLPKPDAVPQSRRLGRMSDLLMEFDHAARRAAPRDLPISRGSGADAEGEEDSALAEETALVLGRTRGEIYLMRLRAFLESFAAHAAEAIPEAEAGEGGAVQIMTVHQAKGLSFSVVFVPCLVDGRFPSARTGEPQRFYVPDDLFDRGRYQGRIDDEARLLYVALTRAEELVVLSWFQRYSKKRAQPSRFVRTQLRGAIAKAADRGTVEPSAPKRHDEAEPLTLDFSSLSTYAACGYRYFLRHVCGFRPPRAAPLGYGRLMHHLIADLARGVLRGETPEATDIDRILDRDFYLPFAGPTPVTVLRESARTRALAYLRAHGDGLRRVRATEVPFEVPLGGARIKGRIDLLLYARGRRHDEVEIVDLKTSTRPEDQPNYADQLRLYGLAAIRMGLVPRALTIHGLDPNGPTEISVDPGPTAEAETRFGGWVEGIRSQRFDPSPSAHRCGPCDFHHFCPHAPPSTRGRSR